jgi:hypothetical protein
MTRYVSRGWEPTGDCASVTLTSVDVAIFVHLHTHAEALGAQKLPWLRLRRESGRVPRTALAQSPTQPPGARPLECIQLTLSLAVVLPAPVARSANPARHPMPHSVSATSCVSVASPARVPPRCMRGSVAVQRTAVAVYCTYKFISTLGLYKSENIFAFFVCRHRA